MDVFWVGVADRAAKSHAPGVIQLVVFSQKKKKRNLLIHTSLCLHNFVL